MAPITVDTASLALQNGRWLAMVAKTAHGITYNYLLSLASERQGSQNNCRVDSVVPAPLRPFLEAHAQDSREVEKAYDAFMEHGATYSNPEPVDKHA